MHAASLAAREQRTSAHRRGGRCGSRSRAYGPSSTTDRSILEAISPSGPRQSSTRAHPQAARSAKAARRPFVGASGTPAISRLWRQRQSGLPALGRSRRTRPLRATYRDFCSSLRVALGHLSRPPIFEVVCGVLFEALPDLDPVRRARRLPHPVDRERCTTTRHRLQPLSHRVHVCSRHPSGSGGWPVAIGFLPWLFGLQRGRTRPPRSECSRCQGLKGSLPPLAAYARQAPRAAGACRRRGFGCFRSSRARARFARG